MDILRGAIGMIAIIGIAIAFSNNRKAIDWKLVGTGLGIQFVLAVFILKGSVMAEYWSPLGWPKAFFSWVSSFFVIVLDFTTEGAEFIFGDLAKSPGMEGSLGNFFAFQVLPTIVFFASLTAILYHYGILQKVVSWMSSGMQKLMGTSGAESLSVVANIFVGQTESPLVIKPYIEKMTKSELLTIMTGGMATIAGGVMAAYVQMLGNSYSAAQGVSLDVGRLMFAEQLLGASLMAAPAALVIAKVIFPETSEPATKGDVEMSVEKTDANGIDAAATGAGVGLKLAANVGAMLLAFIALLAMGNYFLAEIGNLVGLNQALGFELTIETLLGWVIAPIAFIVGVPWADAINMGSLIGTKVVLNEFVAYLQLADMVEQNTLSPKTITMATFALCGFANFSSIAIQIGGIGGLAPSRKSELASFGLLAVLAGTLANLMTATIAGMLY
ncbi:NupC/NupG family nucleoside CNT transporter [Rhodohalobacter sulfatireducens]|uniref:NupC/NupG family nucleoside CNT transporter n=1 Tax=Rhodohalobacter sulfatireducens TaxID=2911366 RepID=A0ABS9KCV1_9BACT|nr:nucleoside transporter C-terminal domain-containing protein [Rhodohalobacter sulfatireducens]MCG2588673.1 NupC/NupG family nucleoside CNT transporter [Rhodohalobacter sulfatireducens]